mgnify:FL=1
MKKKRIVLIMGVIGVILGGSFLFANRDKVYINYVLAKSDYAYLPKEAQEYIRDVYNTTGEVMLTEKNKKEKMPYLNPIYVDYLTYNEEKKEEIDVIPDTTVIDYVGDTTKEDKVIPSSYDLRNVDGKNYVSPVGNQGSLGLCWTFSTTGAAESYLLKKGDTSYNSSSTLFSQRQIDYATANNGIKDYKSEYKSFIDRGLGDGGNFFVSTVALANGVSLYNSNNFKAYSDTDYEKMELMDVLSYSKSDYEVNGTINMPINAYRASDDNLTADEKVKRENYLNSVKSYLMKYGAAYVSTYMGCSHNDSTLNSTLIDAYACSFTGGHAMSIIGWDDDIEYKYCVSNNQHYSYNSNCSDVVSGKGVWIIKNSWGNYNTPYLYLTYDSYSSSISFITDMSSKDEKNWDNNYILGSNVSNGKDMLYRMYSTKLKGNEKLEKIKFMTNSIDGEFDVLVRDVNGKIITKRVSSSTPSLVTVDFSNDNVVLNTNSLAQIKASNSTSVFIDNVSFFTSNTTDNVSVDFSKYEGKSFNSKNIRLYSDTKGIPSGTNIVYRLYNSSNEEVSSGYSVSNNVVAENNINANLYFDSINSGNYVVKAFYNDNEIGSFKFSYVTMDGKGTESDPYVIMTPEHFNSIRDDLDAYYVLGADLDFRDVTSAGGDLSYDKSVCSEGHGWQAINGFSGSLDGQGHSIKNMSQNNLLSCDGGQTNAYIENNNGIFSNLSNSVTIKNIVLEDNSLYCNGSCGLLATNYNGTDGSKAVFENIVMKNNFIVNSLDINGEGGGLFDQMRGDSISFKNIYIDIDNKYLPSGFSSRGLLATYIFTSNSGADISNVSLNGNFYGTNDNEHNDALLVYTAKINGKFSVSNVLSTMRASNVNSNLFNYLDSVNYSLNNINMIRVNGDSMCSEEDTTCDSTNVNLFDKDTGLKELVKKENYSSWENFDENWVMKTVDGIPRLPVLKFMDFEYTKISDININQELNSGYSIYNYMTPKKVEARRLSLKSNDESIVTVNEEGVIVPQKSGKTSIHVENYYDGYIKDVPISVKYVPHYTIKFNSNGAMGLGISDSIEVNAGEDYRLPEVTGTRDGYVFNGWNTEANGSGDSYDDLGTIKGLKDKEEITLYAQWIGEEMTVTFDASGGVVNPNSKIVHRFDSYGELPVPYKENAGFVNWACKSDGTMVSYSDEVSCTELVAVWVDNAYTFILDANGGTLSALFDNSGSYLRINSRELLSSFFLNNNKYTIDKNMFVRNDKTFKEWNTKADGSGKTYFEGELIGKDDVVLENNTFKLYAIWEDYFDYRIKDYYVDETNHYISKIMAGTSGEDFKKKIEHSERYGVEVDTKNIDGKEVMYTGGKTRIYQGGNVYVTYTNIVIGDVNGDGAINSADLLRIRQHLLGSKYLRGENFLASDINYDSDINSADLLRVRQHLLGTKTIS